MASVLFWQGVISSPQHNDVYQKAIELLLYQPTNYGLHLEKLRNSNIYSIRANDTIRLLLTTYRINGKPFVLILKALEEHEYKAEKKFIESGESKFTQKYEKDLTNDALNSHDGKFVLEEVQAEEEDLLVVIENLKKTLDKKHQIQYQPSHYLDNKFLLFNEAQERCHHVSLPLILNGIAGSGKSLICLSLLKQALLDNSHPESLHQLGYVAPHAHLASDMKNAFCNTLAQHNIAFEVKEDHISSNNKKVYFVTYEALQTQAVTYLNKDIISEDTIVGAIQKYINNQAKLAPRSPKTQKTKVKSLTLKAEDVFKDLMLIAGLPGEHNEKMARYLALGRRQTIYHDPDIKNWLIQIYQRLTEEFNSHEAFFPPFSETTIPHRFDCLLADEAQGYYLAYLKLIHELTLGQVVLCSDTNQSWQSVITVCDIYKHFYQPIIGNISYIDLSLSYRNPLKVVQVANKLLRLKNFLVGAFDHECQQIAPAYNTTGNLIWLDDTYIIQNPDSFAEMIDSPNFAVIVFRPSDFDLAIQTYPDHRVFYSEHIQGLEYEKIILFNPFDKALLRLFIQTYGDALYDINTHQLRKHRGRSEEQTDEVLRICAFLKLLFIGTTRATEQLFIYQNGLSEKISLVEQFFFDCESTLTQQKQAAEPEPTPVSHESEIKTKPHSPTQRAAWHNEARRLIATNQTINIIKGKKILIEKLGVVERDIDTYIHKNKGLFQNTPTHSNHPAATAIFEPDNIIKAEVSPSKPVLENVSTFFSTTTEPNTPHTKAWKTYHELSEIKKKSMSSKEYKTWTKKKDRHIEDLEKLYQKGFKSINEQATWIIEGEDINCLLMKHCSPIIYKINNARWYDNKKVTLNAVSEIGTLLKDASPRLKSNYKIAKTAVESHPKAIKEIPTSIENYDELLCMAYDQDNNIINLFNDLIENKPQDGYYQRCASLSKFRPDSIQTFKEFYQHCAEISTMAIVHIPSLIHVINKSHNIYPPLQFLSSIKHKSLRIQKQLCMFNLSLVEAMNMPNALKIKFNDESFVLDTIALFPNNYKKINARLKSSIKILLRAMIRDPNTFLDADPFLKNDPCLIDIYNTQTTDKNLAKIVNHCRFEKIIKMDPSTIQYAVFSHKNKPRDFFKLAKIALKEDPKTIYHIYTFMIQYMTYLINLENDVLLNTLRSFFDIAVLMYFFDYRYGYDEFYEGYDDKLNELLAKFFLKIGHHYFADLLSGVKEIGCFLNIINKSLTDEIFMDASLAITHLLQVDLIEGQLYHIIFKELLTKEKLQPLFSKVNDLYDFMHSLDSAYKIIDPEPYGLILSILSNEYLVELCQTQDDFIELLSCFYLAIDFDNINEDEPDLDKDFSILHELSLLFSFINEFDTDKLQALFKDDFISYENFVKDMKKYQPNINFNTPCFQSALHCCYDLLAPHVNNECITIAHI